MLSVLASAALAKDDVAYPMQPRTGFGSDQFDLSGKDCARRYTLGPITSPSRVSYWIPCRLKNGKTAPVVVFMHGFLAPVPEIYQAHIDHLTRQGYFVIFPQYHAASWKLIDEVGLFKPADQNAWLGHAIASTRRVLGILGERAEPGGIHGYGHSLGGLLLVGWEQAGGPKLKGIVLANPKVDLESGIPKLIRRFVSIRQLPWREMAAAVTGHVTILSGQDDDLVPLAELKELSRHLENAASVSLYIASSDTHGDVHLRAEHISPTTNGGLLDSLKWLAAEKHGGIVLDTYDFRFYFAALDAMLHDHRDFQPDMGHWSDGRAFADTKRLL
jgi:dienelactone hydrolase